MVCDREHPDRRLLMARPAPSVERTVGVLNHLARHPTAGFTLSELARDLGLNKATAHALLGSLVTAGYLVRDDSTKAYTLGPTLISIGNAATISSPASRVALPHMQALTTELGIECVASTVVGDEIVILSRAGTPRPLGVNAQPGQRLAFVPPIGSIFVAWSGDEGIARWLDRLGPDTEGVAQHREALEAVREHGYSVGLGHAVERGLAGYVLVDFAQESYTVHHIGAPVFGADGQVALGLFLIGFGGSTPATQLRLYADRLLATSELVSQELGASLGAHTPDYGTHQRST